MPAATYTLAPWRSESRVGIDEGIKTALGVPVIRLLSDDDVPVLPKESPEADVPAVLNSGLQEIPPLAALAPEGSQRRISLVGCVNDKEPEPAAALEVY
jgi:hypothetical protein